MFFQITAVAADFCEVAPPRSARGTCKKDTTCPVHLHGQSHLKLHWVVSYMSELLMCLILSIWAEASG